MNKRAIAELYDLLLPFMNNYFNEHNEIYVEEEYKNIIWDVLEYLYNDNKITSNSNLEDLEYAIERELSKVLENKTSKIKESLDSETLYYRELKEHDILTPKETKEIFLQMKTNPELKKEFIEKNLRLVLNVVKKYHNKSVDKLDLIQEGNIGLMNAVDKFDVSLGYSFSTFATSYIEYQIIKTFQRYGEPITNSFYVSRMIRKIRNAQNELITELNREPTEVEIAKKTGISLKIVIDLLKIDITPISLDAHLTDAIDTNLVDLIVDENALLPEQNVLTIEFTSTTNDILKILPDKYRDIIELKFGFVDGICYSQSEIAKKYGVTSERIRTIENKAIEIMRKWDGIHNYAEYMDKPDTAEKFISLFKSTNINRKAKTIYEYYGDYSKDEIDVALSMLSNRERIAVYEMWGEELNNRKSINDKRQYNYYKEFVSKKINKLLIKARGDYQEYQEFIQELCKLELDVLSLKFPVESDSSLTDEEIGKKLGISTPQVLLLIQSALLKYKKYLLNVEEFHQKL